jgi:hypothetical protein
VLYKAGQVSIQITAPHVSVLDHLLNASETDDELRISSTSHFLDPPALPVPWQFSYRAALPARAPSIAS